MRHVGDNLLALESVEVNTPIVLAISALFLGGLMKFFWHMGMKNGADIPSFVVDALFVDMRVCPDSSAKAPL